MKAAVYHGPGDIRVEECPEPLPTRDNLIAEVHYCAICGSDKKLATVGHPRWRPPRIIGHEMVGHLVHVGAEVEGFAVGERITLATTLGCLECAYCKLGLANLCPHAQPISQASDGAFAARLAIPPLAIHGGNVLIVPAAVSDEAAALSGPLSCAVNAQERGHQPLRQPAQGGRRHHPGQPRPPLRRAAHRGRVRLAAGAHVQGLAPHGRGRD